MIASGITLPPLRIGISSCLLGERVRFDGGHKRDHFIVDTLGQFFQWLPVCPEMGIGLGAPRESLRLVASPDAPRLIATHSQSDHTEAMRRFAEACLEELCKIGLHGYILKKNSPSCGMEHVRVYGQEGSSRRSGRGLFAEALMRRFPLLPVEEEERLHSMPLRENFIERVFAYYRWQELITRRPTPADLGRFHAQLRLTLMAHSRKHYRRLTRLVASAGKLPMPDLLREYGATLMEGLRLRATPKKHADILYYLLGYLKKHLDAHDQGEMAACIEKYRQGFVPLVVPLTLLQHHFRRYPTPWVLEQTYLQPYPAELMLRNHV
jgi:uncharacterized protein YbgA (DUF1722 family)/uncharacterized protein YbbK (DUF523 family)